MSPVTRLGARHVLFLSVSLIGAGLVTRANARPRAVEAPPLTGADVPGLVATLTKGNGLEQQGALMSLARVVPFEATRPALPLALKLAAGPGEAEVRSQALSFLGGFALEPGVVSVLETALSDADVSIAQAATAALPPVQAALPALRRALGDRRVEIRRRATDTLRRFSEPSPELLQAFTLALTDPAQGVRSAAAQGAAVSAKGQAALGPSLVEALGVEREGLVRALLVRALLETGGASTADAKLLIGLLAADREPSVRYGSAQILGRLRATAAIPALRQALEHDPEALVRGFAAEALGLIGPEAQSAVPALLAMVRDREKVNYRSMAVSALAAIDVKHRADVSAVLLAAVSDAEEETQAAALKAVGARGTPAPALKAALEALRFQDGARNAPLYRETLAALKLPAPPSAPPLDPATAILRGLDDAAPQSRSQAVMRVKGATTPIDPRWLPGLTRALAHPDTLTRRYAAEALGRAGPAAKASVGALIGALLEAGEPGLEREAARALVQVAPASPEVLEALARHLERGQSFVADGSAEALATLGVRGVPALVRGVRSKEPYAGFAAAGALARIGPGAVDAVPALLDLLADKSRLTIHLSDGGGDSRSRVVAALEAIAPNDPRVKAALR